MLKLIFYEYRYPDLICLASKIDKTILIKIKIDKPASIPNVASFSCIIAATNSSLQPLQPFEPLQPY